MAIQKSHNNYESECSQRQSMAALDNQEGHYGLIGGRLRELSAKAWEGYLNNDGGRGALVIQMSEVRRVGKELYAVASTYEPIGSDLLVHLGLWPDGTVAQALESYDPNLEVVVIVVGLAGLVSINRFTLTGPSAPPQAWEIERKEFPIGVHLNPLAGKIASGSLPYDKQILSLCADLVARQRKERENLAALRKSILSDLGRQLEFVKQFFDRRQEYQNKLAARGYAFDIDSHFRLIQPAFPKRPGTANDRFRHLLELDNWLVLNTVAHQVHPLIAQQLQGPTPGASSPAEDGWKEIVEAIFQGLDDNTTRVWGNHMTDDALDPDLRLLFHLLFAARLISMMAYSKLPMTKNDDLIEHILKDSFLVFQELTSQDPLRNDCNQIRTSVSYILEQALTPLSKRSFSGRQFNGQGKSFRYLSRESDSNSVRHVIPNIRTYMNELASFEREDLFQEWAARASLTQLEGDALWLFQDHSQVEIKDELGLPSVDSVKQAIRRGRRKVRKARIRY